ncbi:MAG: ATP-binding cassette domain-containing protein [Clostridiales bacterium]|nr:ATP-binding cassette domain-containing protein [Clostridiales bacterium]
MSDIIISLKDVCMEFESEPVLKNITHDFEKGKIHGIIGKNGSGKTVMMKCICGFLLPTQGEIYVQGKRIGEDVDFPDDIGVIIEVPGFLPYFSGYQNLQMLASLQNRIGRQQIIQAMERVGLNPKIKKSVAKYSLGMKQRLGIAQAIMENPSILILDEPMNVLDKHAIKDVRELLISLRDEGKTILLSSHSAEDINLLCDTICEIDCGELYERKL